MLIAYAVLILKRNANSNGTNCSVFNLIVLFLNCSSNRNAITSIAIRNNKYVPYCGSLFRNKRFRFAKQKRIIIDVNYYSFIANQLTEREEFVMHISFPCIVPFKLCSVLLFPSHNSILTLCNVSYIY